MAKSVDYAGLVEKAQHGDDESLNRLAEHARKRLYAYVFRVTMREELSQDVVQESMLEMFRFLDKLESADRFWPWLRRIALNKVYHHYSRDKARRTVSLPEGYEGVGSDGHEGLTNLVTQELKHIVADTMAHLKARYREVLVMRCYEDMGYSQIAKELGCSEFYARVLFFRAKNSLAKQLSRRGLGKGALLTALVVFGKMTAPSEAAAGQIAVTAAATKVGVAAAVAGTAASKAVIVSLAAASVITVGSVMITQDRDPSFGVGGQSAGVQGDLEGGPVRIAGNVEQCWYFFPDGQDKSVMMRQMMPDARGKQSFCLWLQNDLGNYHYDRDRLTVTMTNHRVYSKDLSVMRLPTDSPAMSRFISRTEGTSDKGKYVEGVESGALVIVTPRGKKGGTDLQVVRHPSLLDEEYFQYDWPADAKIDDRRDKMHKRGWSGFTVRGRIAGEVVKGVGCLPFVYQSSLEHAPWLKLQLGDRLIVYQAGEVVQLFDLERKLRITYPVDNFFSGLGRPWMGLHTIDTIRRDAAKQEVRFKSRYRRRKRQAEVELTSGKGRLVYDIDMKADVIDMIRLYFKDSAGVECEGVLNFSYVDQTDGLAEEIMTPGPGEYSDTRGLDGVLWLLRLGQEAVAR